MTKDERITELTASTKRLSEQLQVAAERFQEASDWFRRRGWSVYSDSAIALLNQWAKAANNAAAKPY